MRVDAAARSGRFTAPEPSSRRGGLPDWAARALGSDPGLNQLRGALQAVATIGVAILAELLFVRLTHALQTDTHGAVLSPAQAAEVAVQHHGVLVVAILLGTMMGMTASFTAAMFATPRAQLGGFLLMPVQMLAGMALGLALAPHRSVALTSFVVVLTAGAYCRRFGPRGFIGGLLVFLGDFFGYFLYPALHLTDLGWLAAEAVIGVLVAVLAQYTLFYPSQRGALRRMQRSYTVRAREVAKAALSSYEDPADPQRASRRLHRRLIRLNETALMIDAALAHPGAQPSGGSATTLHQRLFDSELALTNIARFAERLGPVQLPAQTRELTRRALEAVAEMDLLRAEFAGHKLLGHLRDLPAGQELDRDFQIVLHRFANSVIGFAEAVQGWRSDSAGTGSAAVSSETAGPFAPGITLLAGWLPGSAIVSAAASLESGQPTPYRRARDRPMRWDAVTLPPYSRVAIQIAVAATAALLLGDLVSGRRFYWALLAAFVTFMGTNNVGEQLRKGFFRAAGTMVGVLLGAIGAHLVGNRTGIAIAVILGSLFLGLCFMRISYAFLVVGVTITVSQIYVQVGEFTNSLLLMRLEETALGAGVTAITVLCVFPLRTGRVARVAARQYVQALAAVVEQAVQRLTGDENEAELRSATRRLDGSYQTLVTTMQPLGIPLLRTADSRRQRLLQTASAARHYARNLLSDTAVDIGLAPQDREQFGAANRQLAGSIGEVIAYLQDSDRTPRTYTRAAALFDAVASRPPHDDYFAPGQLALRDLQLLDGAMAHLAESVGLDVHALDTDRMPEQPAAEHRDLG
jgi:hypothetical protein